MSQELDEKIARFAGIEFLEKGSHDKFKQLPAYRYPDGCIYSVLPKFTESLDACFKWVMPKLYAYVLQSFNEKHRNHHASVVLPYTNLQDMQDFGATVDRSENPAIALCLAVEKLIDST